MIYVENKKKKEKTLLQKYPNALILDITSKGEQPWVKLSPFYPHGNIPIPPYPSNYCAMSIEGIWQGLKVFETEDIDLSKFEIENMEGIKRTVRKFGKPLGHRNGVDGKELLDYPTARKEIYLRAYAWVLDNKVNDILEALKYFAATQDLVLLDYNTNEDLENFTKPLSHAGLVKKYLIKKYPVLATLTFEQKKVEHKVKNRTKSTNKKKKDNLPSLF
ncbi:MAG: hypothetical protein LBP63_08085 [Prevotellaceae bacterium]|jgi:hypothetical protein|nr:hypothetical protein [Prevotellaceae bacterium]